MQVRRLVLVTVARVRRRAVEERAAAVLAHRETLREMVVAAMPMVERNARGIARRLPPQIDKQDLVDAGYLALVEAAQKFDPTRGVTLEQYAMQKVRGAMWDTVRRGNWREMSHLQLPDERAGEKQENEGAAAPLSAIAHRLDPEAVLEEKRRQELATTAMECLSDRERLVVQRFYAGDGLGEIAEDLGLCKATICIAHRQALRKMQAHFAMRGIKAA